MDENRKKQYEKEISLTSASIRTVCEVHQEMWDIIDQLEDVDIKKQLRDSSCL